MSFMFSHADIQQMNHDNSPCVHGSRHHDLKCGHFIRTQYEELCGWNCKRPKNSNMTVSHALVCPACVTKEVQEQIEHWDRVLEDLDMTREERAECIAADIVEREQSEGGKITCSVVTKAESGYVQYYVDFAADIEAEDKSMEEKTNRERKSRRLGRGSRKTAQSARGNRRSKAAKSNMIEHQDTEMEDVFVESFSEDEEDKEMGSDDQVPEEHREVRRNKTERMKSKHRSPDRENQSENDCAPRPEDEAVNAVRSLLETMLLSDPKPDESTGVSQVAQGVSELEISDDEDIDEYSDSEEEYSEAENSSDDDYHPEVEDEDGSDLDEDDLELLRLERWYDLRNPRPRQLAEDSMKDEDEVL